MHKLTYSVEMYWLVVYRSLYPVTKHCYYYTTITRNYYLGLFLPYTLQKIGNIIQGNLALTNEEVNGINQL